LRSSEPFQNVVRSLSRNVSSHAANDGISATERKP
jgi:hypothetical protein